MRRLIVRLNAGGGSYPILVENGAHRRLVSSLERRPIGASYLIITDHNVRKLYGDRLLSRFRQKGIAASLLSFTPGEASKNLKTIEALARKMLKAGYSRADAVIALGGGVVGDVAGYLASSFMRGIPYLQAPTTLLAMVDSSIGGKVAVDLPEGKNIIGHFWQPSRVFIDTSCLRTLPDRQRRSGWVEVIKHGVIADRSHFEWLEKNAGRLPRLRGESLEGVLARSLMIKSRVVRKDEREADFRMVLNYGHTIGHAIESLTGYRKYTHGEAVAIGMNVEGRIAFILGLWPEADLDRQNRLLGKLGMRISFPSLPSSKVLLALRRDKKAAGGAPRFALPRRIGAMQTRDGRVGIPVEPAAIRQALREATI